MRPAAIALLLAMAVLASCSIAQLEISAPVVTLFPGIMSGKWRVLRTADYPDGDTLGVSLTVQGDQFVGIGTSWANMAGPIVACHVDSSAQAVCKNVMGKFGGGITKDLPEQTVQVISSYINNNYRTVEFVVPISSLNLTSYPELNGTRLIFAHGHWDATNNLPTYHGPNNCTIVHSNLFVPTVSPVFDVFPGQMNVQWRVFQNAKSSGGDVIAVVLKVFSFSGDAFAGIGFSPLSMAGSLVVCNIPSAEGVICKNFVGENGGGVSHHLPPQTVKVLWASVHGDERSVEFEVPLSALNVTAPATTFSRLIFAHGHWDAKEQRPTYHGPNNTILHVNIYTGEIRSDMVVDTTWSAPRLVVPGMEASWRLHLNGTGREFSYIDTYFRLNTVGQYYAAIGWLTAEHTGVGVMANFQPGSPLIIDDVDVSGPDGQNLDFAIAAQQVSTEVLALEFDGITHIIIRTPLSRAPIDNLLTSSFFATADVGSSSFPGGSNSTTFADINFYQNVYAVPRTQTLQLLGGVMTAQWRLVEFASQFRSVLSVEFTLSLIGSYDNFMAIGHSPESMYGTIVACHVDYMNPTNVVCRDFIGQHGGGVKPNPIQSTAVVGSSHNNGISTVTFVVPFARFNLTYEQIVSSPTRLIFAHGRWNSTTQEPTYHGPNNCTIRHVAFMTGADWTGAKPPQQHQQLHVDRQVAESLVRTHDLVRKLRKEAQRLEHVPIR